jgi:hypothetical protein
MIKYISKGEWFDKGTEAKLLCQYIFKYGTSPDGKWEGPESAGIFEGIRSGEPDEEGCGFDEFNIVEE